MHKVKITLKGSLVLRFNDIFVNIKDAHFTVMVWLANPAKPDVINLLTQIREHFKAHPYHIARLAREGFQEAGLDPTLEDIIQNTQYTVDVTLDGTTIQYHHAPVSSLPRYRNTRNTHPKQAYVASLL